jgi:thioredoxin 1
MAKVIGSSDFKNEVKDGVVIVDFFAQWCAPCKMLAPIFEELGIELEGRAKFIKVDVDQSPDIASKYSITNIPAMLILKDGEKIDSMVGFSPKEIIKEKVEQYL